MMSKLSVIASALVVAAGLAAPPAFAQTAPATSAQPAAKPAVAAEAKPAVAPVQKADAACAVHKKDSKEFKDCVAKTRAASAATAKDPLKKTN